MTYRLDEIKDFLVDSYGNLNEDFEDELYDLLCSEYGGSTLTLSEFDWEGTTYPAKTFHFNKTAEEKLDDYCEGKTQYHYDITLVDTETGDTYKVYTGYFNDNREYIEINYQEPKKVKKINGIVIEECCDEMKLYSISAKCNDMFSFKKGNGKWKEGSPSDLNLGKSDYVEFTFCKSCGKIHFK